jgi:extracellular elastinolytic metalloproteinase
MNNKLKKLLSLGLALFCSQAQAQDPGASRNFDARVEHNRSFVVTPGVAQAASVNALRTAVPGLSISYDNATGVTRTLSRAGGYLTEVDGRSARDVALEYARANASLLGLEQADLENYEITDEVRSRVSRSSHIYFRQTHLGLPVYNGQLQINMNKKGRVSSVNNAFMPAAAQAANKVHPTVSPEAAVSAVAGHLGVTMTTAPHWRLHSQIPLSPPLSPLNYQQNRSRRA